MDVKALQRELRDFAAARDWQPYHAPKNLAMALMVEAAELLELFQWHTLTESRGFTRDPQNRERVADELADVLLYLLQLADHTGVDLEQAVAAKLVKNAAKHPPRNAVAAPAPVAPAAPRGGRVHLLVDWENVQPDGAALQALEPRGSNVWLFHGPQQRVDTGSHVAAYGADCVTLVPRTGAGRNALDFQLSYYVGYISARQPEAAFVVVSNDQGYDPMLAHARELGFDARRVEYRKPVALPVPVKKPAKPQAVPAPTPIAWDAAVVSRVADGAGSNLRTMALAQRPRERTEVLEYIGLFIAKAQPGRDELAQRAWQLLLERGDLLPPAPGPTVWEVPANKPVNATPDASVTKATRQEVQMLARLLAELPAARRPASKTVLLDWLQNHLREVGRVSTRVEHALAQLRAQKHVLLKGTVVSYPGAPAQEEPKPNPKPATQPLARKQAVAPSPAQVAQAVLASLQKMPKNKPARPAGLLKFIETHAAKAPAPQALAQQVYALLQARQQVVATPDGKGLTYPKIKTKKAASA